MFNWIKNIFGSKQEAPKAVLDTTTNWPFPTAGAPPVNDPAPVIGLPAEIGKELPAKKPRKPATKSKAATAPTKEKKPAAIKTQAKTTKSTAEATKRSRKPKAK